jgi:type I restriction enzyme S subunit
MTNVFSLNLPEGWKSVPMWTIATRKDRKGYPEAELLSVYRDYGVIRKSDRDDNHNVESEDLSNYKFVKKGDLVLNKMKTWQGSLGVSSHEGIVSPAYFTFELNRNVHGPFIHYLLRSEPYIAMYRAVSKGIRVDQWDLPYEEFRKLPVLIPPIEAQRKIADFLDNELMVIDQLISLKKKTIELNLEGFNASRHELVTGSKLTPQVETDIGWLDTVPKMWKKSPLRSMVSFQKGKDPARLNLEYCATHPGDFPVYSGQTENDGLFAKINTFDFNISGNALLIRTVGTLNLVGTTTLISGKFSLSQNCALILPRSKDINMNYLHYVLPSLLEIKKAGIPSDMQASLRFTDLSQFWLHWPTIGDQFRISEEISNLEAHVTKINELIRKSVNFLEEYRNSLITQIILGNLDIAMGKSVA